MGLMSGLQQARALALAVPAGLLGGAYISEYVFGLYPCEMCWWQRWPHFAALALALASYAVGPHRVWAALAGLAVVTSGLIGGFHAGVEYGWWEGVTGCTAVPSAVDVMDINAAPTGSLRCCTMEPLWGFAGWLEFPYILHRRGSHFGARSV